MARVAFAPNALPPPIWRAEMLALRRLHGDAEPGVLARLALGRLSVKSRILEAEALAEEAAALRRDLETLRLAVRFERLRAEFKANFNPDQPRDPDGKWTSGGGGELLARLGGGGGGAGGGGPKGSPRICSLLSALSIDGIICLYSCPDGSTRRFPTPFPVCPNVIFNFEGD